MTSRERTVFRARLDGDPASDEVIVANGSVLIQEGDTLPAIGGIYTFTGFGTGPVAISNSGQVLWYGEWNDPNSSVAAGLFLDDQLVVQQGVSKLSDSDIVIETLRGTADGYAMSDDGHWILFEAEVAGGLEGVFLIDRTAIFSDGFENGDISVWSLAAP